VTVDPLLELLLKFVESELQPLLLLLALLERLGEFDNLVLEAVRNFLELGHGTRFGFKGLQLLLCQATAKA
jgi:hypothetical protein